MSVHSIQYEIDHLEFEDGAHISAGPGARFGPPHRWAPILHGLDKCTRCRLTRFQLGQETVYQYEGGRRLMAGAAPRCKDRGPRP